MDKRLLLEITPEKTRVIQSKNALKIVHINKAGKIKRRECCDVCVHRGKVQLGLGYGMYRCCDKDWGTKGWREFNGFSSRKCKDFKEKQPSIKEKIVKMNDDIMYEFNNAIVSEEVGVMIKNSFFEALNKIACNPQEVVDLNVSFDGSTCIVDIIDKESGTVLDLDGLVNVLKNREI